MSSEHWPTCIYTAKMPNTSGPQHPMCRFLAQSNCLGGRLPHLWRPMGRGLRPASSTSLQSREAAARASGATCLLGWRRMPGSLSLCCPGAPAHRCSQSLHSSRAASGLSQDIRHVCCRPRQSPAVAAPLQSVALLGLPGMMLASSRAGSGNRVGRQMSGCHRSPSLTLILSFLPCSALSWGSSRVMHQLSVCQRYCNRTEEDEHEGHVAASKAALDAQAQPRGAGITSAAGHQRHLHEFICHFCPPPSQPGVTLYDSLDKNMA